MDIKMTNNPKINAIHIKDDLVTSDELISLSQAFSSTQWRLDWPLTSTPFARPCWHFFIAGSRRSSQESCEDELRLNEQWGFLAEIWNRLKQEKLKNSILVGVYANGQTFDQDSPIHRDNLPKKPGKTVVLFCNEYWASTWGGELTFFDTNKNEIIQAILPKPGRAVIFDGEIPHRARAPTIDSRQLRTTIAFKTIEKEFQQ